MSTLKKKNTSEHPLPDLRPDLESWASFSLEKIFKVLNEKSSKKHIPASGVDQGHSTFINESSVSYVIWLYNYRTQP
jgi:hypothetical protein